MASHFVCVCQAAELVTSNLSEYESHMLSTKLYLEQRLEVSEWCG